MNKHVKSILIGLGIFLGIIVVLIVLALFSLNRYHNRNTWATLSITDMNTGNLIKERECLKGYALTVDDAVICIGRIEHDGSLVFSVTGGALYDESGNEITEFTMAPDTGYSFTNKAPGADDCKTFLFQITSHRYA